MIKALGKKGNSPVLFFGLSEGNIDLLKQGKPIIVDLAEMGSDGTVIITYGKTEIDIMQDLQKAGIETSIGIKINPN